MRGDARGFRLEAPAAVVPVFVCLRLATVDAEFPYGFSWNVVHSDPFILFVALAFALLSQWCSVRRVGLVAVELPPVEGLVGAALCVMGLHWLRPGIDLAAGTFEDVAHDWGTGVLVVCALAMVLVGYRIQRRGRSDVAPVQFVNRLAGCGIAVLATGQVFAATLPFIFHEDVFTRVGMYFWFWLVASVSLVAWGWKLNVVLPRVGAEDVSKTNRAAALVAMFLLGFWTLLAHLSPASVSEAAHSPSLISSWNGNWLLGMTIGGLLTASSLVLLRRSVR